MAHLVTVVARPRLLLGTVLGHVALLRAVVARLVGTLPAEVTGFLADKAEEGLGVRAVAREVARVVAVEAVGGAEEGLGVGTV